MQLEGGGSTTVRHGQLCVEKRNGWPSSGGRLIFKVSGSAVSRYELLLGKGSAERASSESGKVGAEGTHSWRNHTQEPERPS